MGRPENLRPPYWAFHTNPTSLGPIATCARFHDCQCTSPWRAAVAEPTATAATATTAAAGGGGAGARREPAPRGRGAGRAAAGEQDEQGAEDRGPHRNPARRAEERRRPTGSHEQRESGGHRP